MLSLQEGRHSGIKSSNGIIPAEILTNLLSIWKINITFMLDKIAGIEERYRELNQLLMEVGDDYQRATELSIERAELEPLIVKFNRYREVLQQLEEARSL